MKRDYRVSSQAFLDLHTARYSAEIIALVSLVLFGEIPVQRNTRIDQFPLVSHALPENNR